MKKCLSKTQSSSSATLCTDLRLHRSPGLPTHSHILLHLFSKVTFLSAEPPKTLSEENKRAGCQESMPLAPPPSSLLHSKLFVDSFSRTADLFSFCQRLFIFFPHMVRTLKLRLARCSSSVQTFLLKNQASSLLGPCFTAYRSLKMKQSVLNISYHTSPPQLAP